MNLRRDIRALALDTFMTSLSLGSHIAGGAIVDAS
jgi:hypothetical protein